MKNVYSISLLSFNKNISLVEPKVVKDSSDDAVATIVKKFKEPEQNYTMITKNNITEAELIFFSIPNTYNPQSITLLLDNNENEGTTQISSLFFVINENNASIITKDIIQEILKNITSDEYHVVLLYNITKQTSNFYIQNINGLGLEEITDFDTNELIKTKVNAGIKPSYSTQLNKDYKIFITNYLTPFLEKNNPKLITKLNDIIVDVDNTQINKDTYFKLIFESYNEIIRHYDNLDKDHNIKKIFAINENQNNTINKIREYNPFNKKQLIKDEFREHEFSIYNLLYGFYNLYEYTKDICNNIVELNTYIKENSQDFTNYIKKLEEKVNKSIITYVKINNTSKFDNNFRFKITPNETKTNMNVEYSFNNIKYYNDDYEAIKYNQVDSSGSNDIISFVSETKENNKPLYSFKFNKSVEDIIYANKVLTKIENRKLPLYPNISLTAEKTEKIEETINASKQYTFGNFTKIFDVNQKNIDIVNQMQNITNLIIHNSKPPPIFIVGYGSSGAGKTSNLIYFRNIDDPKESEDGILPNLCTKIIQEEKLEQNNITLMLKTQEFYNNNSHKDSYKNDYTVFPLTPITYTFKYANKNFILETDTNIEIQHKYRFGFNFYQFKHGKKNKIDYIDYIDFSGNTGNTGDTSKIFDPSGNDDGKQYFFKKGTPLGLVITFLVDIDRIVKATTNNPQSSRSHVLVYVDMDYIKKSKPKKVNLIVGDFAGIENEFNCGDPTTIETMHKQPNTLNDKELFYMDAIIPEKKYDNIDTIGGGEEELDIDFNNLNQPYPKIDVKIKEYENKYTPEIIKIIDEIFINSKLISDNVYDNDNIINTQKNELEDKIIKEISIIYKSAIDELNTEITEKETEKQKIKLKEYTVPSFPNVNDSGVIIKIEYIQNKINNINNIIQNVLEAEKNNINSVTSDKDMKSNENRILQGLGKKENKSHVIENINIDSKSLENIFDMYIKINENKNIIDKNNSNTQIDKLDTLDNITIPQFDKLNITLGASQNKIFKIDLTRGIYDRGSVVDEDKILVSAVTNVGKTPTKYTIYFLINTHQMGLLQNYNNDVTKYNSSIYKINTDKNEIDNENKENKTLIYNFESEIKNLEIEKQDFTQIKLNEIKQKTDYNNENNELIKKYIIINKTADIQNYIKYKIIKRNILNKACTNRLYEGYFINQSLKDLREAIQIIIQSKGFDIFYNYIDSCYAQYSPDDLIYDETGIEKKIMKNIFITEICKHINKTNNNLTIDDYKQIVKQMVICIYCVFNIAYKKNNPPTPTYYNINFLNMLSEKDITLDILNKEKDNFKKLEYVCQTYKEFNIDIIIEQKINNNNINNIPKNLSEVVQFIYSHFELINNAVKKEFFWKLIDQVRTTINIINSTSSMGSLEFIDQIAKLNTTSVVCTPETEQESIPITNLFTVETINNLNAETKKLSKKSSKK